MKTYRFTVNGKAWRIVARNYEIAVMILKVLTHCRENYQKVG